MGVFCTLRPKNQTPCGRLLEAVALVEMYDRSMEYLFWANKIVEK